MKLEISTKIRKTVVWVTAKLAFVFLVVLAAYGMRELLDAINETIAMIITLVTVGALVFIVFEHKGN